MKSLKKIKDRIIDSNVSLIVALKQMDKERVKSLLAFEDKRFCGMITIGDIQRAIIANMI